MASSRPAPTRARTALEPQRRPGKLRVAALLRAAADVFAERGFEAATMAEIAARAKAPIGSLYRFFPSKDALADALMRRYSELIAAAFADIDRRRPSPIEAFADALLDGLAALRGESKAIVALLDSWPAANAVRDQFHAGMLGHIVRTLRLREPRLTAAEAESMAVVLLQNMKAMKSLDPQREAGVIAELSAMTRLYLASKLSD